MKIRNKKTGEIREFDCTLINSSKLSAQNRQRLYWVGKRNPDGTYSKVEIEQPEDRGVLLRDILETGVTWRGKTYTLKANYYKANAVSAMDGGHYPAPMAAEPIRVGTYPTASGDDVNSQSKRIYSVDGKSCSICASSSGGNSNTSSPATRLYDEPVRIETIENDAKNTGESNTKRKVYPVYEVRNGMITIKGKQYPIKLSDGYYVIRKLTVTECKRLQTVPDSYEFPVSNTQAYKMLGNGWTVDVISHILSYCPGITTEPLDVLSMYDGMACGHIALDKLGAHIARYRATEIDKYAIKTACHNFADIQQLGDAYQVRDW